MRCDPQTIGLRPIPLAGMVCSSLSLSTQKRVKTDQWEGKV